MPKKIIISKEKLEDAYHRLGKMKYLCNEFNISHSTLTALFKQYNIKRLDLKKISDKEIINTYIKTGSLKKSEKILGINKGTIKSRLVKLGVCIKLPGGKIEFNLNKNELEKLYKQYKSAKKIGELFNVSEHPILDRFKELGIETVNTGQFERIRTYNDNFFSEDNEKSFYWAGFIAADGCIYKDNLQISLSSKDHSHLEKFKQDIGFDGKISKLIIELKDSKYVKFKQKFSEMSRLFIHSKIICNDLSRFGIGPRKSLTYLMPDWLLQHSLLFHFIRGYFDGDGSFMFHRREKDQARFFLVGTKEFLLQIQDLFKNQLNYTGNGAKFNKYPYTDLNNKIYNIGWAGNKITKSIVEYMYSDATVWLDRKYNLIKHFIK